MNRDEVIAFINLYSSGRFEEAVNSFFTEDASFWNTRIALRGRQKIIDWLMASHLGHAEKVAPVSLIVEPDGAAFELEQEFHAHEDMSHFFIQPMKKGEVLKTRGVSWFLKFREGKICSLKEYRLLYRCDPKIFMTKVR
ncbi:MAG TPA: nuclear transport factor 2 family protein [Geomonas sp.]|nr:nuclear transport factor 2 family protein [Geomonas sp.]